MVALKDRMFYDMLGCCAYHYTLEKTGKNLRNKRMWLRSSRISMHGCFVRERRERFTKHSIMRAFKLDSKFIYGMWCISIYLASGSWSYQVCFKLVLPCVLRVLIILCTIVWFKHKGVSRNLHWFGLTGVMSSKKEAILSTGYELHDRWGGINCDVASHTDDPVNVTRK